MPPWVCREVYPPGICTPCTPGVYTVYIASLGVYGVCKVLYLWFSVCPVLHFFPSDQRGKAPALRKGLSSPQDIPSFPGETGGLCPTNPLQKALAHKEVEKRPTPPEVTSNPPRCYDPPFLSRSPLREPRSLAA